MNEEPNSVDSQTSNSIPRFRNFKFGLRQLFYVTALIAAGMALDPGTIVFSTIVLLGWGTVFLIEDRRTAFTVSMLIGIFLCCAGGMLLPNVQTVRAAARRSACQNNLKQIMLGILNYESAFGHFPTDKIVATADGQQLRHSWRVLILPHIEQNNLYEKYDFNEAWNGPKNIQLESEMSDIWSCSSRKDRTKTTYQLVNGPGTAFEIGTKHGIKDVMDGCSNTVAIIEDAAHPVSWLEPGDFTAEEASEVLNSIERKQCAHVHDHIFETSFIGSQLALLDGSTWNWPYQPDTPVTAGAFLIDDGIAFDGMVEGRQFVEVKYHAYIALGV